MTGSRLLFTNEYKAAPLQERTGWSREQVLDRAGAWIVTRGAAGCGIGRCGEPWLHVDAVPVDTVVDPTGGGRRVPGFLAARAWGLSHVQAARPGSTLAGVVLRAIGPQTYTLTAARLLSDLRRAYGADAAREFAPHLGS